MSYLIALSSPLVCLLLLLFYYIVEDCLYLLCSRVVAWRVRLTSSYRLRSWVDLETVAIQYYLGPVDLGGFPVRGGGHGRCDAGRADPGWRPRFHFAGGRFATRQRDRSKKVGSSRRRWTPATRRSLGAKSHYILYARNVP